MPRLVVAAALSTALLVTGVPLAGAAVAGESTTTVTPSSSSVFKRTSDISRKARQRPVATASPTAVQPAGPPLPANLTVDPVHKVDATTLGAVGDGVTDDTVALQRALDSLPSGGALVLPAGRVFAHSGVLRMRVAHTTLTGGGTLRATDESRSSLWLDAPHVLLQDIVLRTATTTRRWDAYEQMGLRLAAHPGITVRRVGVYDSAAAGIYVGGASNFLLEDVLVRGSRADGIHITEGSHDGQVRNSRVVTAGDDGIAVVSYAVNGAPAARILVSGSSVKGGRWGRGFSVVGGEDIRFERIYAETSNAAALYLASEGAPYYTTGTRRVTVVGARFVGSNSNPAVDHGAVLIWNGRSSTEVSDIALRDVTVQDTRSTAHRHTGVLTEGGTVARIEMTRFTLTGGPQNAFVSNAPSGGVVRSAWTQDGVPIVP